MTTTQQHMDTNQQSQQPDDVVCMLCDSDARLVTFADMIERLQSQIDPEVMAVRVPDGSIWCSDCYGERRALALHGVLALLRFEGGAIGYDAALKGLLLDIAQIEEAAR